jgi:uncharacterized membrane protein
VSEPANASVPQQPMPTPTRVAGIALGILAALLLVNASLTLLGREAAVDQYVEAGIERELAEQSVLISIVAFTVIGLGCLLAAVFLLRRRSWARPVGIVVTALLVLLALLSVLAGGLSAATLLVLVAAVAALTSLLNRQTKVWLHGVIP